MSRQFRFLAVFLVVAVSAIVVAFAGHRSVVFEWNRQQLAELAVHTVTRTDVAIDRAVIAIGDLVEQGHTQCNAPAVAAIRSAVFRAGGIRDIQITRDGRMCQAFEDSGIGASTPANAGDWRAARNGRIALAQIVDDGGAQLGVKWQLGAGSYIVAVVSTDGLIFDVLPQAVREGSSIELMIDGDYRVAGKYDGITEPETLRSFMAASSRYPTTAHIHVAEATFAAWRSRPPTAIVALALALSLAFGYAVARALARARDFAGDFRSAMARSEIMPYYQPIVALGDGAPIGFEILARWRRPDGTFISPAQFIPLVELNGCADDLVAHLMRRAWLDLGSALASAPDLKLAVNIAPMQLETPGFADWFTRLIDETGFARNQIVIEVTERQPLTSIQAGQVATNALRKAGFDVALDDTGTGHNGLAVMKSMHANRIKIDKLFVDEIDNDFRTRALVEMLVQVAHELGMVIVAEGIERHEQAVTLDTLGVEHGQGFLYAQPMPADEAIAYLRRKRPVSEPRPTAPKAKRELAA